LTSELEVLRSREVGRGEVDNTTDDREYKSRRVRLYMGSDTR